MKAFEQRGIPERQDVLKQAESAVQGRCPQGGAQRLSLSQLHAWEDRAYGMFICFGMWTYFGRNCCRGDIPISTYAPDKLDVDQWIQIARDAGMKYAVLTAKHAAGFCLWPTRYTDYNVRNSGNKKDVIEAYVRACERRGILPGLYYGSRDLHNGPPLGCKMPTTDASWKEAYTTSRYQDFMRAQIDELLQNYGPVAEFWVDAPVLLGQGYRTYIYNHIASLQPPDCVIMLNHGWPSDLMSYEQSLPVASSLANWQQIRGCCYYMPTEADITMGKYWFYLDTDKPRPDEELLNIYTVARQRRANLLLAVPPDTHGRITAEFQQALMRLARNAGL